MLFMMTISLRLRPVLSGERTFPSRRNRVDYVTGKGTQRSRRREKAYADATPSTKISLLRSAVCRSLSACA
jgi:hypothetical protein